MIAETQVTFSDNVLTQLQKRKNDSRDHCENFEVFENDIFDCKVLWMVGESEWNSVVFFVL